MYSAAPCTCFAAESCGRARWTWPRACSPPPCAEGSGVGGEGVELKRAELISASTARPSPQARAPTPRPPSRPSPARGEGLAAALFTLSSTALLRGIRHLAPSADAGLARPARRDLGQHLEEQVARHKRAVCSRCALVGERREIPGKRLERGLP